MDVSVPAIYLNHPYTVRNMTTFLLDGYILRLFIYSFKKLLLRSRDN